MKRTTRLLLWVAVTLGTPSLAAAQARPFPGPDVQQIYQRLLPQIEKIPMFDHHAHPAYADDLDVDAMATPPGSAALRERDTNPELVAAAKALWGYPYNDLVPEHAKWLLNKKTELKKQLSGTAYFNSILDKINIESSVADVKNTGGRWGGAINAALFLKEFVDKVPWAHMDVAGSDGGTLVHTSHPVAD